MFHGLVCESSLYIREGDGVTWIALRRGFLHDRWRVQRVQRVPRYDRDDVSQCSGCLCRRLHSLRRRGPAQRRLLLHRVQAFIEQHLAETTLTPATIAAAHYLSLRSLQQLFAEHESTVAGSIRHRRLEHARTDLIDPARADTPVSAIAARWGLPDPTHFGRLFRRAYGTTPADYRRTFQQGAT